MNKKDTHLTVRISSEELQKIKEFAEEKNTSLTDFVLDAIRTKMGYENELDKRIERLEQAVFKKQVA